MKKKHIVIVGGGASGIFLATVLAKEKILDVLLIERNERLGKKLSSTGNGQGNITNQSMNISYYFSSDLNKAEKILNSFNEENTLDYLSEMGGIFLPDERGRIYPSSRQASSVTDLFRYYLQTSNTEIWLSTFVKSIQKRKDGFIIDCGKESVLSDAVIICTGGMASKNYGTDGNGYALAKAFSHKITPLYPSLVQLKTNMETIKGLKGIRAEVILRAFVNQKQVKESRGDIIFTDYGISGNAVFQVSPYLIDKENAEVEIEFLPDVSYDKLFSSLKQRENLPKEEWLCCILNNTLARAIMKQAKTIEEIAKTIKAFPLKIIGSLGFDYAQVTHGGIEMQGLTDNLESKYCKNLFFCGEIVDVDGECGGYNLQWAFSSAMAVARKLKQNDTDNQ